MGHARIPPFPFSVLEQSCVSKRLAKGRPSVQGVLANVYKEVSETRKTKDHGLHHRANITERDMFHSSGSSEPISVTHKTCTGEVLSSDPG
jgi:hypothetical protein